MNAEEALELVGKNHKAVLATIKRDGRPQLSNVSYTLDGDGRIKISTTRDRAKISNLRRDPRAVLSVQGDNFRYLVVEGSAEIIEDNVLPELRRIYVRIRGEQHPNWEEFNQAMVREKRVVLSIGVDRIYPLDREW